MKKAFVFVIAPPLFSQCHDVSENRSFSSSNYHRGVGSSIPIALANEWISNYNEKKSGSVFRNETEYQHTLSPTSLADAINVSQDVIGATFQNAIDSYGTLHVLFVPFIEGLSLHNDVAP